METNANEEQQDPAYGPILSTDQVVDLLGLSAPTVRKLVQQGHLPAHRPPGGRKLLFQRDEVLAAVATWTEPATQPQSSTASAGEPGNSRPLREHQAPDDDNDHRVLTIDADGDERWIALAHLHANEPQ